jgi:hypothetical protein
MGILSECTDAGRDEDSKDNTNPSHAKHQLSPQATADPYPSPLLGFHGS